MNDLFTYRHIVNLRMTEIENENTFNVLPGNEERAQCL